MSTVELSLPRSVDLIDTVTTAGDATGWRFLARWSLFAVINGVVGWTALVYIIAQGVSVSGDRGDLNVALALPGLWRVAMVSDIMAWLFIGGTVLLFAAILSRDRPMLGLFVAAAAIAQLFGAMGGYVRLHTIADLAGQYASAAPDQQAAVLQTDQQVSLLVTNLQSFGGLLTKLELLVIGCTTYGYTKFPRWLAVGFVAQAVLGLTSEPRQSSATTVRSCFS